MRFLSAFLGLAISAPLAAQHSTSIEDLFAAELAKVPEYALALGYASPQGSDAMMAGPIHKGSDRQVNAHSLWHIGSITKSFTATLVMQQVDRGALSLDAPISTYIGQDGIHPGWQRLTLRQLLSHTAGLRRDPRMMQVLRSSMGPTPAAARRAVLESFWGTAPANAPGTFEYSNLGYILIGLILEEVTQKSWEELILRDIAAPLGLESLGFGAPNTPDSAWGHRNLLIRKAPVPPTESRADNPAWLGPAGTLHMSIQDLVRWGEAHIHACAGHMTSFLSSESCRAMIHPTAPNYGFGWLINDAGDVAWHNGSNTMWIAQLMLHHESGSVVAVAHNVTGEARIDLLAPAALNALIRAQRQ